MCQITQILKFSFLSNCFSFFQITMTFSYVKVCILFVMETVFLCILTFSNMLLVMDLQAHLLLLNKLLYKTYKCSLICQDKNRWERQFNFKMRLNKHKILLHDTTSQASYKINPHCYNELTLLYFSSNLYIFFLIHTVFSALLN